MRVLWQLGIGGACLYLASSLYKEGVIEGGGGWRYLGGLHGPVETFGGITWDWVLLCRHATEELIGVPSCLEVFHS